MKIIATSKSPCRSYGIRQISQALLATGSHRSASQSYIYAERGVKLSSDFLASPKGKGHYQNVLQVVEQDRHRQPDLHKRKNDFLLSYDNMTAVYGFLPLSLF